MGTPRIFLDEPSDTLYIMWGKGPYTTITKDGAIGARSTLPNSVTDLNAEGTWQEGFDCGFEEGREEGYDNGYELGYEAGIDVAGEGW